MKLLCVVSLLFAANAHAFVADAASTPVRHDQDHRSLFFSSLFRLRRQPCVGTEPALRENLAKGGSVTLCRGSTIVLQSAIVVNDLSFDVRCEAPPRLSLFRRRRQQSKCVISGNDATNLFTGSPSVISFQDVEFQNGGKDPSVLCCGGAFFIDAGRVTFEQCTFSDNKAPVSS